MRSLIFNVHHSLAPESQEATGGTPSSNGSVSGVRKSNINLTWELDKKQTIGMHHPALNMEVSTSETQLTDSLKMLPIEHIV